MAIATGTALAIGAIASAGTGVYAQHKAGQGQQRAAEFSASQGNAELDFMREQAALEREERAAARASGQAHAGAGLALAHEQFAFQKQMYEDRNQRAAPYRAYGQRSLAGLAAVTNPSGGAR